MSSAKAVIVPGPYVDLEMEGKFETIKKEELSASAVNGKLDGEKGEPATAPYYWSQTVKPVVSKIQSEIDYNYSRHPFICDAATVEGLRSAAKDQVAILQNEKQEPMLALPKAQEEEKALKAKCRFDGLPWSRRLSKTVFGITEGLVTISAIKPISSSIVTDVIAISIIAWISYFGIQTAGSFIVNATDSQQRKKRYWNVLILGLSYALLLGYCRAELNNESLALDAQIAGVRAANNNGALLLFLASVIVFMIALHVELSHALTKEEKANLKAYKQKQHEVMTLETTIRQLDDQIDTIQKDTENKIDIMRRRQFYAASMEVRLVTLAQEIIDTYEKNNLNKRRGAPCPEFFNQKIDNSMFKLYYHHIHEKTNTPA
ncbi:MAG: hypothetical protein EOO46_01270 [Flavobacterium sp.]|nr:MAG: hypothetical protein EOO46_01270 [Flavobacterium sp.]